MAIPLVKSARTELLIEFVKRLVARQYKGSWLGVAWTVLDPLLMALVYTMVFAVFFGIATGEGAGRADYALMVLAGLVPFRAIATVLNQSTNCVRDNANLVKRVVFPVEILPVATAVAAVVNGLFGLLVLLVLTLLLKGALPLTVVFLPVVYGVMLIFVVAAAYFLSAAATLVRDVGSVVPPVTRAALFLTPVVWPLERLSEKWQTLETTLNPFAVIVVSHKNVVFYGTAPLWRELAVLAAVSLVLLFLGRAWFRRQKRFFPEVL